MQPLPGLEPEFQRCTTSAVPWIPDVHTFRRSITALFQFLFFYLPFWEYAPCLSLHLFITATNKLKRSRYISQRAAINVFKYLPVLGRKTSPWNWNYFRRRVESERRRSEVVYTILFINFGSYLINQTFNKIGSRSFKSSASSTLIFFNWRFVIRL